MDESSDKELCEEQIKERESDHVEADKFISSIEEDPVTQQVQVEKLSEKQTEIADKKQQLQDRCDELETQVNELIAKIHAYKKIEKKLNDMLQEKVIRESELEEWLEKMKAGNKVLKQKKDTFEKELEEANEACTLYQAQLATEKANHHETHAIMTQEVDKMRNANIVLQQRMREAWLQVDALQQEIFSLKTNRPNFPPPPQSHSQSPYGFTPDDDRSRHNDPQTYPTIKFTREADLAVQEAEVARQRLEAKRRTGPNIATPYNQTQPSRKESDTPLWLLDSSDVTVTDEKLGTGSYGTVQVALFRGTRVAAKCMHELILSDYNKELFVKEMNMSALLHHPNIVQFIGALVNAKNSILLYELMETSLYSYMQKGQALPRPLVISIGCDVSSALAYLHLHKPHPIMHRDVSSPNVLMESLSRGRWRCKLSDFGSARLQPHAKTKGPGNAYYSSHEAGDPVNHTPAMDVYSFGVLLTEITLRRPPAPDTVSRETQAKGIDWVPMKDLILQCLMKDRFKRPEILVALDSLARLQQEATKRTGQPHVNNPYSDRNTLKAGKLQGTNTALPFNQRGSSPHSRGRYPVNPEDVVETIRENYFIEDFDREIYDVAEGIRRMTRPPSTLEIQQDENSDIPYDPNLTCPGCGQRYRFGEIQKLRRHVNEFCTARDKYTQQF